jgi:hypothetical protein
MPACSRPETACPRALDESREQEAADALATGAAGDVDAHLGDAGVRGTPGDRGERRPAENPGLVGCHESMLLEVARIPLLPRRNGGLEGGVSRRDSLGVDLGHRRPDVLVHRLDPHQARQ